MHKIYIRIAWVNDWHIIIIVVGVEIMLVLPDSMDMLVFVYIVNSVSTLLEYVVVVISIETWAFISIFINFLIFLKGSQLEKVFQEM